MSASAILSKAHKDVARVMEKALADITKLEGASKAPAKPKASVAQAKPAPAASKTSTVTLAVVKKALEGKNSAKARTFYCIDTKKVGARSTLEKENSHYAFHEREDDDSTFVRVCGTKLTPKVLSALGFSEVKKSSTPEPLLNEESDEEEEAEEGEEAEEEVEDDEEEVDEAEEGEEDDDEE